jgi:hypothetical protein
MYEIAIINPRPKKARRKTGRKSGASKMAKRKKVARGAGGRFKKRKASAGPRKRSRVRRVKASQVTRRKRRRSRPAGARPATGYVVGNKRIRRYKLNPRSRRRRRSNPRFSLNSITSQMIPAAYGAGGAIALDIALGYIPLPARMKTGYAKHAVKIVGALGVGMLASKFLPGNAKAIGQGALTVAMYGLLKDVFVKFAPAVKGLGDYEEVVVSEYTNDGVGAYFPTENVMDPAPQMGAYMGDYVSMDGMDF